LRQHVADAGEGFCQHGQQGNAFVGQRQSARQPAEQRRTQLVFQVLHMLADGGLCDVELAGGSGEAQVAGGGFEGAQCVQG